MDELRQLLRYEIPGLITILYFLMFTYHILFCFEQVIKILIVAPILALPIGFLLYQVYTTLEHKMFLENREGIRLIEQIFKEKDNKIRKKRKKSDLANFEAISIIICHKKSAISASEVLGGFQNIYHSRRVIGYYIPVFTVLFVFIFYIFLYPFPGSFNSEVNTIIIQMAIALILIFAISLIMILPTRREGFLKKEIDELEKNIIYLYKGNTISKIIRKRSEKK